MTIDYSAVLIVLLVGALSTQAYMSYTANNAILDELHALKGEVSYSVDWSNFTYERVKQLDLNIQRANQTAYFLGMNTTGLYTGAQETIWISTGRPRESVERTMLHEYAHYLYYEEMSASQRLEWENISNEGDYVTVYASSSPAEDFAESYAYSTSCSFDPQNLSESKKQFLLSVVNT